MPWAGARLVQTSEEVKAQHSGSGCTYQESSWWAGASSFLSSCGARHRGSGCRVLH